MPGNVVRTAPLDIVVVTHNSADHIGPCVDSICAAGARPIVIDNASTDATLDIVRARCRDAIVIASPENLGYGRAMNLGFRHAQSEYVVLSNADVVFPEHS